MAAGVNRLPRLVPVCDTVAMVYWDTMLTPSSSMTLQSSPDTTVLQA